MINNKRRLNGYNSEKPETFELADCIGAMTDRAKAILTMIQDQFVEGNDIKLKDEIIYQSLDTVLMEIIDINNVVNSFNESSREISEKNQKAQKSPD